MSYPKLTDLPTRFDLVTPNGVTHTGVTLRTVKALIAADAKLYLAGEHLYTFGARDKNSESGLFWGYVTHLRADLFDAWTPAGSALRSAVHPPYAVPEGDYTIAVYGGVIAFGRAAVRALLAERNAKHGPPPPPPKPQLYLHLTFEHGLPGRTATRTFALKWGETAPKEAVDFVLTKMLGAARLTRAMISTFPDPAAPTTYRETMLGVDAVERLLKGAKLDEVWTCN